MNIEKCIINAVINQRLEEVQVCESYRICGLVKFKGEFYYFPDLTKRQLKNTSSCLCEKHKEEMYKRAGLPLEVVA